jgi:hypothetical protein
VRVAAAAALAAESTELALAAGTAVSAVGGLEARVAGGQCARPQVERERAAARLAATATEAAEAATAATATAGAPGVAEARPAAAATAAATAAARAAARAGAADRGRVTG